MIYNNVEYLSLPQQVEKNKDDIAQLKTDTAKRVYLSGDTLPTPAVGECHNYLIGYVIASDEGPQVEKIGGLDLLNPSIVSVCNLVGVIYVYPNSTTSTPIFPSNLVFTSDYRSLTTF